MTESRLEMRVGDRLPSYTGTALDEFGDPIDLTGYRAFLCLAATNADTVFGQPSPYVTQCTIADPTNGVTRYDWTQDEVDAAVPSTIEVTVRFVQIADPDVTFEVPSRRTATIIMRPSVESGRVYLLTDDGSELLLDDDGQPQIAV